MTFARRLLLALDGREPRPALELMEELNCKDMALRSALSNARNGGYIEIACNEVPKTYRITKKGLAKLDGEVMHRSVEIEAFPGESTVASAIRTQPVSVFSMAA